MARKIKIAYLIDTISSDKAGTEKQLLNLIERLDRGLFRVTLVCLHESTWLTRNDLPCELIILGYKGFLKPNFPSVLWRYLCLLKERRFDIVQTFFEDSMFVGCLGKFFSSVQHALIVSRRDLGLGSDEPNYHWLYKKIKPFILRFVDGIAANAHAIRDSIACNEKVAPEKIIVIGNGLDIPVPPNEPPQLFSEYQGDLWFVIVANLKPVKRIDLLLRALAYMKETGIKETVRAVIIGDGWLKPELLQLAEEAGIDDRVHFIGSVENVSDYLFGADIGVLCSDKEGLSNAILEYMACGLPVVATNAGGNSELVDDTNGVCVPVGDHIALAGALVTLMGSPARRRKLGNCSLDTVRQHFTWDTVIPLWERYYFSLEAGLASHGNPPEGAHAET